MQVPDSYAVKKGKGKVILLQPGVAQKLGRGIALLFPGRTVPPGKTRYPFYRRLDGPQGRSGWAENLVLTWIGSWTVQPIVSHYTNRATWPMIAMQYICKMQAADSCALQHFMNYTDFHAVTLK